METQMVKVLNTIEELDQGKKNFLITIFQGNHQGEKAILSDERLVWSTYDDFFIKYIDEIMEAVNQNKNVCNIKDNMLFIDQLNGEKELVICGAGHVSIPIIKIGLMLEYKVIVIEDRPTFADHARAAGATQVICDDFEQGLKQIQGGTNTYFVVVTRGHKHDQLCLESIVPKPHAYIGLMGSKRRTTIVKDALIEKGCNPDTINQIHTPIGLEIGAETPEEIAISIMAEIIKNRNLVNRFCGFSKEIKKSILAENNNEQEIILATIIKRKGSAPRTVGTKMLIYADGTTIDTIGGGCLEAQVISGARLMFTTEVTLQVITVDMTRENAEDEGMVCGGVIDVLLERLCSIMY